MLKINLKTKIKPVKGDFDYIYEQLSDLFNLNDIDRFAERADIFSDCKPKLDRIKNTLGSNDKYFIEISDMKC